jgi:hypothetical protein
MDITKLGGSALDHAVALCLGIDARLDPTGDIHLIYKDGFVDGVLPKYSESWTYSGHIIENLIEKGLLIEAVDKSYKNIPKFRASMNKWDNIYRGDTVLEAALRCFVATEMGDEKDILAKLKA